MTNDQDTTTSPSLLEWVAGIEAQRLALQERFGERFFEVLDLGSRSLLEASRDGDAEDTTNFLLALSTVIRNGVVFIEGRPILISDLTLGGIQAGDLLTRSCSAQEITEFLTAIASNEFTGDQRVGYFLSTLFAMQIERAPMDIPVLTRLIENIRNFRIHFFNTFFDGDINHILMLLPAFSENATYHLGESLGRAFNQDHLNILYLIREAALASLRQKDGQNLDVLYRSLQDAIVFESTVFPIETRVRETIGPERSDIEEIFETAAEIVDDYYLPLHKQILSLVRRRRIIDVSSEKSLFLAHLGIENIEFRMVPDQIDRTQNIVTGLVYTNEGFILRFDLPYDRNRESIVRRNAETCSIPFYRANEIMTYLQSILTDLLRSEPSRQRSQRSFAEVVDIPLQLPTKQSVPIPNLNLEPVSTDLEYPLSRRGGLEVPEGPVVFLGGEAFPVDLVNKETAEVTRVPFRRASYYSDQAGARKSIQGLVAEKFSEMRARTPRGTLPNSVEELDPATDWEVFFRSACELSTIWAMERFLPK